MKVHTTHQDRSCATIQPDEARAESQRKEDMTNLITQPTNALEFMFEGNEVRVVRDEKGEPWFVAKDVAETLGYTDTDQAIRTHCKATKTYPVNSTGQVLVQN